MDMAYLDLSLPAAAAHAPAFTTQPRHDPIDIGFAHREWQVIALAERDPLNSLEAPGRIGRALAWMFGGGGDPRLADPKLEALRRLAVLAWHKGYAVPVSAIKAFKEAGFTVDQLEVLLASIGVRRTSRGRRASA
jgi:hypothetical protein